MANRREFLQAGLTALALPLASRTALSPGISAWAAEPASTPLYKVIFDERFASCRTFASEAKRLGSPVHGIKGDITDVWFHDLSIRWKAGPAAIAGLTAHGAIFCLERLAWDQRMRVVFRGEHSYGPNGRLDHVLSAPPDVLRQTAGLDESGPEWAGRIASVVVRFPANRYGAETMNIVTPSAKRADDPEQLISWVIAPVRSA
jgi:hypothetical protein